MLDSVLAGTVKMACPNSRTIPILTMTCFDPKPDADARQDDDSDAGQKPSSSLPWYKDGLRFQCTECGKCCTGSPGFVWVSEDEMAAMAAFLNISLELFKRKYVRRRGNHYALVEKKKQNGDYDCIFLKDKKCQVYQTRPTQCRTYPWWRENLATEQSWKDAAMECEGINDQAPLLPYSQIVELVRVNESRKSKPASAGQ
jgi:Fe-S-cluster containining protein